MDKKWVIELKEVLKRLEDKTLTMVEPQWKKQSIYKVPVRVTGQNKEAYQPQVVSFGPYHHGEEHLMPMEEHKRRALFHFFNRTNMTLQIIFDNLTNVVQDFKDSYDLLGDVWQLDTQRFLWLMVLDGCFMLEVMYYYADMSDSGNYAPNDPIFSAHGRLHFMHYIKRDMLLLENQLPMLVLIELAAAMDPKYTEKEDAQTFLTHLIFTFTKSSFLNTGEYLHMLDVFRWGMFWTKTRHREERKHVKRPRYDSHIILSATKLQEAGIRFKKSKPRTPDNISFKDNVLHLPVLIVDDTTESMFLNLIAFERLHFGAGNEITSYIFFMGAIINSVRDVILLESNGIIKTAIGSEQAIVELFKSLSKGTKLEPGSNLDAVVHDIIVYRWKPWIQFRANIVRAYNVSTQWNPLAHISIIFAILLFTLSLVQTVYTISPYYRPNK